MKILLASWVDAGGAPRSTVELARRLAGRGHEVGVLLGAGSATGPTYQTLVKAAIKIRQGTGVTWPRMILRAFGARGPAGALEGGVSVWRRGLAENALRALLHDFGPEVVVANSFPREQMRWVLEDVRAEGIPLGLYMREEHSITHLTMSRLPFDFVVANSEHLASAAIAAGYPCSCVPSVVDLSDAVVETGRRELVLVNPVEENRPEILREFAAQRPDIPCVLQESWLLPAGWRDELERWVGEIPNLLLRKPVPTPAEVYREARLLVAPYGTGRPRVVLEAQYNGIPVVAADQPALREVVGAGGAFVPLGGRIDEWIRSITRVWDDSYYYDQLSELARRHAHRPEIDPDLIVEQFEQVLAGVAL